jgi:hypothetical protein
LQPVEFDPDARGMRIAAGSSMTKIKRFPASFRNATCGLVSAASLLVGPWAMAEDDPRYDANRDEGDRSDERDDSNTSIALDFDVGVALDQPGTKSGGGGALRVGQELDLLLFSLTPELGGHYHAFGGDDQTRLYGGFLGGRLAIGKIIEPAIFAHAGIARVEGFESRTAPMLDGGLALDFTLLPLLDLGVHGAYNVMLPRDEGTRLEFVTLGAHAALVL